MACQRICQVAEAHFLWFARRNIYNVAGASCWCLPRESSTLLEQTVGGLPENLHLAAAQIAGGLAE